MKTRFRYLFMGLGSAVVLGALLLTDPDQGISTGMLLLSLVTPVLAVAFAHLARRALFDYIDLSEFVVKAKGSPVGAGLVVLGVAVVVSALLGLFGKSAQAQSIPIQAERHLPTLRAELSATWPGAPSRAYFGALIEHESGCPSMPRSCWNPAARLKSQREEGAGLGQLTRAWRSDGSLRFDKLAEMRQAHPALRELSWATIYQRPDLQMRTMIIMVRQDYLALAMVQDPVRRLHFTDAAYNGGRGGVQSERRACQIAPSCDPQQWFGHVERHCLKSRAALYGGRSACDINRHHVTDVILRRLPRYLGVLT